ncbi:cysteine-rich receptor-like protein kinase 10 isoform X2 [Lactuca sativa]|uniref:cysteine-rich receptor-like protein kinase 10 isoform X2 n=1 Tax=Lactuca sativa TaxID=4236 RepID=UPI001C68C292|nr:cysteine-rich receptor-like protein kinase 10 isoform X2 [Lactuca sativa]
MIHKSKLLTNEMPYIQVHTLFRTKKNSNGFYELDSRCGKLGNFTQNSAYEKNLNDALLALAEAPTRNSFFSRSSNSSQDNESSTAYAIAICPGDIQNDTCLGCVRGAPNRLKLECPNQKKATAWYYRTCILSYSNNSFDIGDGDDDDVQSFPARYIPNWDFVVQTLMNLLKQLLDTAATDGYNQIFYFASATLPSSRGDFEVTMQCIPTISYNKCEECLVNATEYLLASYNGSTDGLVYYRYSCLIRYIIDLVNTVDQSPPMPPTNLPSVPPPGKNRSKVIIPVVAVGAVTLAISTFFICLKFRRICSEKGEEEELFEGSDDDTGEIIYFRLNAIQAATRNFSDANKLGEGGFGSVYWGILTDGKKIAVKRLSQNSSQGMKEFKTEVKLIITLQHKNLVKLLGCCMKGKERLLVYEYMSNSSLDKYLFDPKKAKELDWAKRVNIVNGIAKGLRYLHEDSRLKIIHRDLKASNVLLDDDMNPKISDFGTARIFGSNQIEANTNRVVGTYGYMAPEYAMEGLFSIKSDVYSFGVLLLEIISGKRNSRLFYEEHDQNLLYYAWMLWEEGKGEQLIDENMDDDCPVDEGLKWMRIALLCVEEDPNDRPTMSSVVFMLEGEWKSLSDPKPPMSFGQFITFDNFSSTWNDNEFGFYSANETQTGKSSESRGVDDRDV